MPVKRVLRPERLRHIPGQFSWIDQRLVREGHIQRCGPAALALYLFLLTVADRDGLSYYAERTLGQYLSMDEAGIAAARAELIRAGLIAYQAPLYQVLSLDAPPPPRRDGIHSVAGLLGRCGAIAKRSR
jgi:hypothetical protein